MQRKYNSFHVKFEVIGDFKEKVELESCIKKLNEKESYQEHKLFNHMKDVFELLKNYGFEYFRGQHHSWDIVPSIERYNIEQQKIIRELKEDLKRKFPDRFPEENLVQNESQYQHFGIPTKLIDVSLNPWIAYYFMFEQQIELEKDMKIGDELLTKTFYALKQKVKKKSSFVKVLSVDKHNPRITAQEGLFLFPYDSKRKSNGKNYVEKEPYEFLKDKFDIIKITICSIENQEDLFENYRSLIIDQQSQLKLIGYTQNKVYPDFHKLIENTMKDVEKLQDF